MSQVTISLRGRKHTVTLPQPATVGSLRDALSNAPFGLERDLPHRLIAGGRTLTAGDDQDLLFPSSDQQHEQQPQQGQETDGAGGNGENATANATANATGVSAPQRSKPSNPVILVVPSGAGANGADRVNRLASFRANRERNLPALKRPTGADDAERSLPSHLRNPFGRIEAIPGRRNTSAALSLLKRVAGDKGVLKCMRSRGWTVGALLELPEIESDSSKLLGLNRNRGQEILLRLTFSDASLGEGFRSYESIIDTMLHELVHNEIGPHNREFHAMHRELKREYAEAHAWDDTSVPPGGEDVASSEASRATWTGGSGVLGGGSHGNDSPHLQENQRRPTPAEMAARAAIQRLTELEVRLVSECGNERENVGHERNGNSATTSKS